MIIHKMSDDEKIQEAARLREKALHDEATALGHARREGIAEGEQIRLQKGEQIGLQKGEQIGLQKGRAEERAKLEANLRALGLSEDMINKALSKD